MRYAVELKFDVVRETDDASIDTLQCVLRTIVDTEHADLAMTKARDSAMKGFFEDTVLGPTVRGISIHPVDEDSDDE